MHGLVEGAHYVHISPEEVNGTQACQGCRVQGYGLVEVMAKCKACMHFHCMRTSMNSITKES